MSTKVQKEKEFVDFEKSSCVHKIRKYFLKFMIFFESANTFSIDEHFLKCGTYFEIDQYYFNLAFSPLQVPHGVEDIHQTKLALNSGCMFSCMSYVLGKWAMASQHIANN